MFEHHTWEGVKSPLDSSASDLSRPNWPINHNLPLFFVTFPTVVTTEMQDQYNQREYTSGLPLPWLPGSQFKSRDKIVPFSQCLLPDTRVLYVHGYDNSHHSVLDTGPLNPGNVYTLETLEHWRINGNALAKAVAGITVSIWQFNIILIKKTLARLSGHLN